jgi:hypothetical protein
VQPVRDVLEPECSDSLQRYCCPLQLNSAELCLQCVQHLQSVKHSLHLKQLGLLNCELQR